jgi:RNA polymerase sigma factor (sigma-70 family)
MLDEKEIEKFLNREDVVRDINIRSHHYTFQDTYIYIPELKRKVNIEIRHDLDVLKQEAKMKLITALQKESCKLEFYNCKTIEEFEKAYCKFTEGKQNKLSTWAQKVVENHFKNLIRKEVNEQKRNYSYFENPEMSAYAEAEANEYETINNPDGIKPVSAKSRNILEVGNRARENDWVTKIIFEDLINSLNRRFWRIIWHLKINEGYTNKEVADYFGKSERTIERAITESKKRMGKGKGFSGYHPKKVDEILNDDSFGFMMKGFKSKGVGKQC